MDDLGDFYPGLGLLTSGRADLSNLLMHRQPANRRKGLSHRNTPLFFMQDDDSACRVVQHRYLGESIDSLATTVMVPP